MTTRQEDVAQAVTLANEPHALMDAAVILLGYINKHLSAEHPAAEDISAAMDRIFAAQNKTPSARAHVTTRALFAPPSSFMHHHRITETEHRD